MTPIFIAKIRDHKLEMSILEKDRMKAYIYSLKDGLYDVIIKKHKNKRTIDQNAYYWSTVIHILSDYFGYEPEEMHEELKLKFNPVESKLQPGKIIGGSTTKMSTDEFFGDEQSYINRIRRWASVEFAINIPDPRSIDVT